MIRQGDPSSMILYLIYSHALVAIPAREHGNGGAYIDDNFFTAQGDDFTECDLKINHMLDTQETWSLAHNSHAELTKFKCLHLTHHAEIPCPDFKFSGSNMSIKCVNSARLLGIETDQMLHWKQHIQHAIKKGTTLLTVINILTRPSFRLPAPYV